MVLVMVAVVYSGSTSGSGVNGVSLSSGSCGSALVQLVVSVVVEVAHLIGISSWTIQSH